MSSTGIGFTVFAGFMIGIGFSRPDVPFDVMVTGSMMWGLIAGFVFGVWRLALEGIKPPTFGSRH